MTRSLGSVAAMAAGLLAFPCAALAGPVQIGEQQGLGLMGPEVPAILKQAKLEPYARPVDCSTLNSELASLNEALGPDADEPQVKRNPAGKLVTKAIRGMIPHRDIVRFVTGAGRKESALQQAAIAGYARRGYLKGISHQMSCNGEQPLPTQEIAAATSAPTGAAADAAVVAEQLPQATPDTGAETLAAQPVVDTDRPVAAPPESTAAAVNP